MIQVTAETGIGNDREKVFYLMMMSVTKIL
jgi:hypothetical protein